jgi:hypothetical protein
MIKNNHVKDKILKYYQYFLGNIKENINKESMKRNTSEIYKVLVVHMLLHTWISVGLRPNKGQGEKKSGMKFLRAVAGYSLVDKRSNKDIRLELRILCLNTEIEEYQVNCLQHLNRKEEDLIPTSYYIIALQEEEF